MTTYSKLIFLLNQDKFRKTFYIPKDIKLFSDDDYHPEDIIENRYVIIPIVTAFDNFVNIRRFYFKNNGYKQNNAKLIHALGILFLFIVKRIY